MQVKVIFSGSTRARRLRARIFFVSAVLIAALSCLLCGGFFFSKGASPAAAAPTIAAPVQPGFPESCLAAPSVRRDIEVSDDPAPMPDDDPLFHTRYTAAVVGKVFEDGAWQTRFRVYYQGEERPLALTVAELLSRFYWYGRERLDPYGAFVSPVHSTVTADGAEKLAPTSFYLDNSHPGGGREADGRLYMLQSGTRRHPLEVVREVAHEFSHLTVPGIHEFTDPAAPEDWLNGYLGEALYMQWLGEDTEQSIIPSASVANWSAGRQRVLENAFLKLGPERLLRNPAAHFWETAGFLLYIKQLYGTPAMARILKYSNDFRRNSAAAITVNTNDAMDVETWDSVTVPGDLAAPISGSAETDLNADNAKILAPGAAVRAWVFLHAGGHKLITAAGGEQWRLRGARIGAGKAWSPLGTVTAGTPEIAFPASGAGWYETQWRNTGSQPISLQGWTWKVSSGAGRRGG